MAICLGVTGTMEFSWLIYGYSMVNHWNNNISGWWRLEHEWIMTFPHIGNFIIPTDELMFFQRGRLKPPTKNMFIETCVSLSING